MESIVLVVAGIAVVAAILCAIGGLLAIAAYVLRSPEAREDGAPGIGCALLGLLWAGIAALLLWMIRG